MGQEVHKNPPPIMPVTDDDFFAALKRADRPVVLFCHQENDETCEFNNLVIENFARNHGDQFTILSLDMQDNQKTAHRLSLPEGSLLLMIRNEHILGYKRGKLNAARLQEWINMTQARPESEGVKLEEFVENIERKQNRQQEQEQASIRRSRILHGVMATAQLAGGLLLASAFPVPGFGLAGCAIAAYSGYRGYKILSRPERPQPPQSKPAKLADIAMNITSWAGSFGLIGLAYGTMGGAAFYATMSSALIMLGQSSAGLGGLLPASLLIGSLRRDAEEISRRDPTKPLDEFSPSAPQEIFEPKPQSQPHNPSSRPAFDTAMKGGADNKAAPAKAPQSQMRPPAP